MTATHTTTDQLADTLDAFLAVESAGHHTARQTLALAATTESLERIAQASEAVAIAAGGLEVATRCAAMAHRAAAAGEDINDLRATIFEWAMDALTETPDDRWSGRSNDIRRSKGDGARKATRSILERISQ